MITFAFDFQFHLDAVRRRVWRGGRGPTRKTILVVAAVVQVRDDCGLG